MKVTRNVILDLLPLVLADEAHEDTRLLVEEYLTSDPKMAALAEQAKTAPKPPEIPIPLTPENEMKSLERTKRLMFQHNLFLILSIAFTFLFIMGIAFPFEEAPQTPVIFFFLGTASWLAYAQINQKLSE